MIKQNIAAADSFFNIFGFYREENKMENLKKIAKEWNALITDIERWKYLLANKGKIMIRLDNDGTYASFCEDIIPDEIEDIEEVDDFPELNNFHDWVGNSGGLDDLFSVLGIEAEGV